ncbi:MULTISPECIES: YuiB family protein [Sporosarcina]|uniref:YuiB family protein n=1 Tax=Sporosarcina TaxID=1569 RepID=UPI003CC80568
MFFGIGFLLNMLLRMSWIMAVIYPIVVILIIDEVKAYEYITKPGHAFSLLGEKLMALHTVDIVILSSGMLGAIISGIVSKLLRKQGYQMF